MKEVICQFCSRSTPSSAIPNNWYQADFDLWICPDCCIAVMSPQSEADMSNEDTSIANEYIKKFYNT